MKFKRQNWTVAEDIAFALENACVGQEDMKKTVRKVAQKVGIADHLEHAPDALSGGQKQRVSMAGVMVNEVDILLFDEPLANLDPATGKKAIEIIDQIQAETGVTVIIIEHRLEDVLWRDVDRIVLMRDGRIITDAPPDELLSTDVLLENGIREPLYLTALKYAGVRITPECQPRSIRSLTLTDEDKDRVWMWFHGRKQGNEKKESKVLLAADKIDFTYENGFHALKNINISIHEGELLAIVGTNGAGKSTFSKVVCGFEKQQAGTLTFQGQDMKKYSIKERADRIGYVMQNPNQMISKPMIFDEVAFGLRAEKCSGSGHCGEGGGGPENMRALPIPEMAGFRLKLWAEEEGHHCFHPGSGSPDDYSGRAYGGTGLQALYGDHGISQGTA